MKLLNGLTRLQSPNSLDVGNADVFSDKSHSPCASTTSNTSSSTPVSNSALPPDTSLSDKFNSYCQSGLGSMILEAQPMCEINLLNILKGMPLKLYDEIIEWAHTSFLSGVDFKVKPRNRQSVLNNIQK